MRRSIILTIILLSLTLIPLFSDQKGEELAKKYFDLKDSNDTRSDASMVLIDGNGNKKIRKLEMFTMEGKEGKNSFIRFIEPADVKNTKLLTLSHKNSDNEQMLFLPAMKKTRRISSSSKDGEFVGSDFYYYDLEDREFEDYTYKFIKGDDTVNSESYKNMKFNVIEMTAKDSNCPYSRSLAWINNSDNFIYKMEVYDKKDDKLLKTIFFLDVKKIDGILIPQKTVMMNHKKGSKTLLQLDNLEVNKGLSESIFTVQNLEK